MKIKNIFTMFFTVPFVKKDMKKLGDNMNLDYVVMNIRPNDTLGWIAEQLDGRIISVEPDNYDFWNYCGAYTVYTRKQYEQEEIRG